MSNGDVDETALRVDQREEELIDKQDIIDGQEELDGFSYDSWRDTEDIREEQGYLERIDNCITRQCNQI